MALRPHLKTAKSIDVARLALADNFGGIAVSTLNEASYFFGHRRSRYYVTPSASRRPRWIQVFALRTTGADIGRDHRQCGRRPRRRRGGPAQPRPQGSDRGRYRRRPRRGGARLGGTVGDRCEARWRAGPRTSGPANPRRAGLRLPLRRSHRGGSPRKSAPASRRRRDGCATPALPCPVVSVGSTPTALQGRQFTDVTEVRAGVYMFMDLFQAGIGVCRLDDIANLGADVGDRRAAVR